MPSPANLLTDFILRQSYADLPEPIRHQAKRCLLDSMGALSAGAVTPLARLTARTAERFFQGGECTLIASGKKVSPLGASMANGFASNALDVEHGYRPAQGRPGAALTPVMLAAAEMAETPPSGTDMLAAVAVGYEVGMRSGMYWNRDHARVYTSGLWGAIGAVAAAGRILGLKEDVLLQALNCADYHGPVGFIARGVATPCMAKDGVGWGAHTAMMSILLAQAGFTSPLLDFDAIRRHPKRMASFSDGTTLLCAIWAKTGLETYYGPSPSCFEALTEYDRGQFLHHLVLDDAACHRAARPWHTLVPGQAEGILVGGYTRNFALLLGSPYFPCSLEEKHLLFLEDHQQFGGVDYVSAMISHIEQSGFMASVTGVLFGHYAPTPPPELLARLTRLGEKYGIPVAYCDDFGHGENHAVLPIGRTARLDTQAQTLRYL